MITKDDMYYLQKDGSIGVKQTDYPIGLDVKKYNIEKKIIFLYGSFDDYFNQKTSSKSFKKNLKSLWKNNYLKVFKKNELELIHYRYFIKNVKFIKDNVIKEFREENDVFCFI